METLQFFQQNCDHARLAKPASSYENCTLMIAIIRVRDMLAGLKCCWLVKTLSSLLKAWEYCSETHSCCLSSLMVSSLLISLAWKQNHELVVPWNFQNTEQNLEQYPKTNLKVSGISVQNPLGLSCLKGHLYQRLMKLFHLSSFQVLLLCAVSGVGHFLLDAVDKEAELHPGKLCWIAFKMAFSSSEPITSQMPTSVLMLLSNFVRKCEKNRWYVEQLPSQWRIKGPDIIGGDWVVRRTRRWVLQNTLQD